MTSALKTFFGSVAALSLLLGGALEARATALAASSADPATTPPASNPVNAAASTTCSGRFPNPITDVCWSCLFPLTLGKTPIVRAKGRGDTDNPSSPVCLCRTPRPPFIRVGLAWGFWEPVRLMDVTPESLCFPNLGGMKINGGFGYPSKSARNVDVAGRRSAYHVHYYTYPVMLWLELLTDFLCVERTSFDLAYITELDPLWQNDRLSTLLNPESLIFSNPIATAACAADCVAASAGRPRKEMFWCAGCQGTMYPTNGNIPGEYGDIQGRVQAGERFLFKMHRMLIADGTSGPGAVCRKQKMPIMDKRQYRFQMVNPVRHTKGPFTCPAIGSSTATYESLKSFPIKGEDHGFLIWRKRNCCVSTPVL